MSASMLEYIPKALLSNALASLRRRLAPKGRIIIFITRRLFLPVQWSWQCSGYSRDELRVAFLTSGFTDVRFPFYPVVYWWLNVGNHIVQAQNT